jgi:hypothetical protein
MQLQDPARDIAAGKLTRAGNELQLVLHFSPQEHRAVDAHIRKPEKNGWPKQNAPDSG